MRIINQRPPNFGKIALAFPQAFGAGVIFAYWDTIYFPNGANCDLPEALLRHEQVHLQRQQEMESAELWWDRYIEDAEFRFNEELLAHVAEYEWHIENGSRQQRRHALKEIAKRLSSPLYGRMVSRDQAETAIRKGVKKTV